MSELVMAESKKRKRRQVVKMNDDFPAVCRCGSNELGELSNVRTCDEVFVHNGITYTHAKRFYARCKSCGQTRAVCRRIRRVNSIPKSEKQT